MKLVLPSPRPPIPVFVDRVRMIRRSMRCFVFGLIGAVPILGLGAAILALRLRRQLAEETDGPARLAGVNGCSIVALALALVLVWCGQTGCLLVLGILLSALQGYLLFRQYHRTEPAEWNPARHLAWWGAGLAYAGVNLSSTIILMGFAAFRNS